MCLRFLGSLLSLFCSFSVRPSVQLCARGSRRGGLPKFDGATIQSHEPWLGMEFCQMKKLYSIPFLFVTFPSLFAGLCGHPALIDVGGVPYLVPTPHLDKVYNIRNIAKQIGLPRGYFLGSGAASSRLTGINCEVR